MEAMGKELTHTCECVWLVIIKDAASTKKVSLTHTHTHTGSLNWGMNNCNYNCKFTHTGTVPLLARWGKGHFFPPPPTPPPSKKILRHRLPRWLLTGFSQWERKREREPKEFIFFPSLWWPWYFLYTFINIFIYIYFLSDCVYVFMKTPFSPHTHTQSSQISSQVWLARYLMNQSKILKKSPLTPPSFPFSSLSFFLSPFKKSHPIPKCV